MPYINVQLSQQELSQDIATQLSEGISDIMADMLYKARHLVSVQIQYGPHQAWFSGGESINTQSCKTAVVQAFITQGTNTVEEKQQAIAALSELLKTCLGTQHEASYVLLQEVPATDWGYDGLTQDSRRVRT